KIMFDADSVMMGNTARVGNGQLSVAGNITASGDISSGTVTSGSIVTSQLIIDTLHALSRVAVNHSLMIEKQTAKSYAEVSTTDTAVALVLQKDSAGKGVGIGITPSAGERLSVAGNVGVSGNLRLSNLSGTGDRVLAVDSNGVLKDFPNSCFGLNAFWKTDGNIVPANCNPFIGTTNTFALNFRTANLPRMTITSAGNVGIGTSTPGNNMQLEVQGSVSIYDGNGNTSLFFGREQPTIQAMTATNQYGEWGIQYWQNHGTGNPAVPGGLNFWKPSGSDGSSAGNGGGNNFLFLSDNGQVQIGDKTPDPANSIHTDYKLSVDGKVVARKLVATEVNWADDELTKHLTLDSLQQDEKFVLMFGYLSGIPSGKEVETNGVDFGQMSSLQMRKIERLYKYSFKFNHAIKKIDANILQIKSENVSLKNENEELKKQFNEMKKQIADLQNKMNVLLQSK
ncbi:MAG: hypothetical protein HY841_14820, partial [Bacteroidetes bacterium]|nr:hypothetical protein [Bacteroidota bacterium]